MAGSKGFLRESIIGRVAIDSFVLPVSPLTFAAGAHGLLVETHPDPETALSDGDQSLDLDEFALFMQALCPTALRS